MQDNNIFSKELLDKVIRNHRTNYISSEIFFIRIEALLNFLNTGYDPANHVPVVYVEEGEINNGLCYYFWSGFINTLGEEK